VEFRKFPHGDYPLSGISEHLLTLSETPITSSRGKKKRK
jgi:hypothetical protein